jgi:hypothetical protein
MSSKDYEKARAVLKKGLKFTTNKNQIDFIYKFSNCI